MCLQNDSRFLITDAEAGCICLTEISENFRRLSVLRKIPPEGVHRPICCHHYAQDAVIVTYVANDLENERPSIKFLTIDDEEKVEFSFISAQYNVVFPFSICESGNSVYASDYDKHCLFELDIEQWTFTPVVGKYETEGQTNGPLDKATLSHPAGIAVRSAVIYIAEYPSVYQGAIRLCYSLEGLVKFQSAWKDIASSMGLVSKREALQNPEKARQTKTKVLDDPLPELQMPAASLRSIVESCKARTNANALDITHGSMSSRTAEGVYITLLKGLQFLVGFFRHIRHSELLHLILMKMLNDSLAEAFFGHLTEMVPGNNLTFRQMARRVASEAFHYLLIVLSSSEIVGIIRSRDEHHGTCFYSSIDDRRDGDAGKLLWLFFNAKHETLFTTKDLWRAKRNDDEGLSKMLYMGKMDVCESFLSKLTTNETTAEGKAALRAVTMATKSIK